MKIGDVVVLKSGGPRMVVINASNSYGKVEVGWIDEHKCQHFCDFPEACLDQADVFKFPLPEAIKE